MKKRKKKIGDDSNIKERITVVKTTLNSIVYKKYKEPLNEVLNEILIDTNKFITEARLFANYYVLRKIKDYKQSNDINKIPLIDQNFYYRSMSIISNSNNCLKHFEENIVNDYKKFRGFSYIVPNNEYISTGILQCASLQMETEFKNFINMRFFKYFIKYIKHKFVGDCENASKRAYKVVDNIIIKNKDKEEYFTEKEKEAITIYRQRLNEFYEVVKDEDKKETKEVSDERVKKYIKKQEDKKVKLKEKITKKIEEIQNKIEENQEKINKYTILKKSIKRYNTLITKQNNKITELEKEIKNINESKIEVNKDTIKKEISEYDKYYNLFTHPKISLILLYECLEYFEDNQKDIIKEDKEGNKIIYKNQNRLFSLVPLKQGFTISHIKICNMGLYSIIRKMIDIGVVFDENDNILKGSVEWRTNKSYEFYWSKLFCLSRYKKSKRNNKYFGGEILTDGKAVSITIKEEYIDKQDNSHKKEYNYEDFNKFIGLDPGFTDTYNCIDNEGHLKRCSTKEYRHDSKFYETNKKIKLWQDRNETIKKIHKNIPSSKTTKINKFEEYLNYLLPKLDTLFNFTLKKGYRKLKFRRYVFSNKKLDKMCKDITGYKNPNKKVVVGFGDFSNNNQSGFIKKTIQGPVKKLENKLKRQCTVISIDEFRSSKLCYNCQCLLENKYLHKKDKSGNISSQKIHSVLFCTNKNCIRMTMNRDVNASVNIYEILIYQLKNKERHPSFLRTRDLEKEIDFQKIHSTFHFKKNKKGSTNWLNSSSIDKLTNICNDGLLRVVEDTNNVTNNITNLNEIQALLI